MKREPITALEKQMLRALLAVNRWISVTPIQEIQWARGASGESIPIVRVRRAIEAAWKKHPETQPKPRRVKERVAVDPDDEVPF